jgi:caffeoyl-CoA O-methyltransferase
MEFISSELLHYCEQWSETEANHLSHVNRQSHLRTTQPRMVSGHLQGRFLSLLSRLAKPTTILEIGTFTGYSALCLAEGLQKDGRLITIDNNKETNVLATHFFESSTYAKQIELIEGKALEIIPNINSEFDLVFIDADKKNYLPYFNAVIDKVKSGGLIIADNVLWSGRILMNESEMDEDTRLIHQFNQTVNNDARVQAVLLPIRDGLMILQKR